VNLRSAISASDLETTAANQLTEQAGGASEGDRSTFTFHLAQKLGKELKRLELRAGKVAANLELAEDALADAFMKAREVVPGLQRNVR
jgi:hypothetical protein